eukprot:scaffold42917_cov19-Tisochrysis_lutea.AAC.2
MCALKRQRLCCLLKPMCSTCSQRLVVHLGAARRDREWSYAVEDILFGPRASALGEADML